MINFKQISEVYPIFHTNAVLYALCSMHKVNLFLVVFL